jgi:hypothetical protein
MRKYLLLIIKKKMLIQFLKKRKAEEIENSDNENYYSDIHSDDSNYTQKMKKGKFKALDNIENKI